MIERSRSGNKENPRYRRLTYSDVVKVDKLLKEVCVRQENGIAAYNHGWDDNKIVEHFLPIIPHINLKMVQNYRVQELGPLFVQGRPQEAKPTNSVKITHLASMVEAHSKSVSGLAIALTRRIEALEQELGRVSSRLERAILELGGLPGERPCDEQHD